MRCRCVALPLVFATAAVGDAAFVDTCATIASFSAVVKIADGAGIPLEDYKEEATRDLRAELSIDDFQS